MRGGSGATDFLNRLLDQLPRTRVHVHGPEAPAFRSCGVAGFYAALIVAAAGTLLTGRPLAITGFMACVAAVSFFVWAFFRRWLGGREDLVLLEHVWFALALAAVALRVVGAPVFPYLDIMSPALALFLACGRIGCAMVGCCHGQPSRLGLVYGEDAVADGFPRPLAGIRLFPVPLIEAVGLAAIGVTGIAALPLAPPGRVLAWYLVAYAVIRFGLEGLRGDRRPHFLGLSQSRWMCLAEIGVAAWLSAAPVVHPAVWALLAAVLVAGLVWKRIGDLRRRLLSSNAVGQMRDLFARLAAECGTRGIAGPAVGGTASGLSIAISVSDDQAHVSFSLPPSYSDLRLLCDVAARVLPESGPRSSAYTDRQVLHVLLRRPLSCGKAEGAQADELGLTLYGMLLRPLPEPASAKVQEITAAPARAAKLWYYNSGGGR